MRQAQHRSVYSLLDMHAVKRRKQIQRTPHRTQITKTMAETKPYLLLLLSKAQPGLSLQFCFC